LHRLGVQGPLRWGEGPLLHDKCHPHRCKDKGVGHLKLKFLLRFDQNVEYKRTTEAHPLRDFQQICRVCTTFQVALAVKICLDLLEGLWSYGGFKLRVSGSPKFSVSLSGETMRQTPNVLEVKNVLEVLYHHAKFDGARISTAAGVAKNVEFSVCLFVCLSVCLFVTLLNVRDCAPDFAMKALEYRNDFDAVG